MASFSEIVEEARLSARALLDYGDNLFNPTVRLGVTGLSRAGKTVFITALVHGLSRGGRFPVFESLATGRIARARLEPQPDDAVPRFAYEDHLRTLIEAAPLAEFDGRHQRTAAGDRLSAAKWRGPHAHPRHRRLSRRMAARSAAAPKSYEQWSAESLALSRQEPRARLAAAWHAHLAALDAAAREDEQATLTAARLFTEYLRACRDERFAMSLLPPGRFLMPGNLAGSPALTFAPLDVPVEGSAPEGSLWAMMRRRYEAYKDVVVRPFFRDHFSRLDRQIVSGRCAGGVQRRAGSVARSGSGAGGHSRLFPDRPQHDFSAACSGRGSTASCLPPPRPITCTIPAMTGSRRS